jgi:hypothetical protein
MPLEIARQSKAAPATSLLALAVGAAAFGAVAIGALAIGRLTVGRLTIRKARFNVLEVDQLTVRRLRVLEGTTSDHAAWRQGIDPHRVRVMRTPGGDVAAIAFRVPCARQLDQICLPG